MEILNGFRPLIVPMKNLSNSIPSRLTDNLRTPKFWYYFTRAKPHAFRNPLDMLKEINPDKY